jgi:hypothetical protein
MFYVFLLPTGAQCNFTVQVKANEGVMAVEIDSGGQDEGV